MSGTIFRAALLLLMLPLGTSCLRGNYNRARVYQEPPLAAVEALAPGVTDVGAALDSLGAPLLVVEIGRGLALAWGWEDVTGWNLQLSIPIGNAPGNLRYTSADRTTRGLVLFFDQDWRLTRSRRGFLSELLPQRALPRDVEDELLD